MFGLHTGVCHVRTSYGFFKKYLKIIIKGIDILIIILYNSYNKER